MIHVRYAFAPKEYLIGIRINFGIVKMGVSIFACMDRLLIDNNLDVICEINRHSVLKPVHTCTCMHVRVHYITLAHNITNWCNMLYNVCEILL